MSNAERGVSLKEVQEVVSHASLTMTTRYAHLAPERLRTAVSRLEGLTSQSRFGFSARVRRERGSASEVCVVVGSPGWARTSDFLINSQALYRLSYRGVTDRTPPL